MIWVDTPKMGLFLGPRGQGMLSKLLLAFREEIDWAS